MTDPISDDDDTPEVTARPEPTIDELRDHLGPLGELLPRLVGCTDGISDIADNRSRNQLLHSRILTWDDLAGRTVEQIGALPNIGVRSVGIILTAALSKHAGLAGTVGTSSVTADDLRFHPGPIGERLPHLEEARFALEVCLDDGRALHTLHGAGIATWAQAAGLRPMEFLRRRSVGELTIHRILEGAVQADDIARRVPDIGDVTDTDPVDAIHPLLVDFIETHPLGTPLRPEIFDRWMIDHDRLWPLSFNLRRHATWDDVAGKARADAQAGSRDETRAHRELTRNEQILTRWSAGLTLDEVGAEFGVTRERVRQIVKSSGWAREFTPADRREQARNEELAALEAAWLDTIRAAALRAGSGQAIADETGLAYRDVMDILRRNAIDCLGVGRYDPRDKDFSDQDLIDALLAAREANGGTLTSQSYRAWVDRNPGQPSGVTVANRFRTWSQACKAAGIEARSQDRKVYWTWPRLIDAVRRFLAEHPDERPTVAAYDAWASGHKDRPSLALVRIRFGGFGLPVAMARLWQSVLDEHPDALDTVVWDLHVPVDPNPD